MSRGVNSVTLSFGQSEQASTSTADDTNTPSNLLSRLEPTFCQKLQPGAIDSEGMRSMERIAVLYALDNLPENRTNRIALAHAEA